MAINPARERLYKTDFAGVELRFNDDTQRYDLSTFNRSENKWRYRFTDIPVSAPDFLQHWLASFNWNSMHAICLTKVRDNGILYIRKDFMRETSFNGKKNYNIKNRIHAAIHQNFGIRPEMVEQALAALQQNLDRKKASGLWIPRKQD
jgi:hypothetical protein